MMKNKSLLLVVQTAILLAIVLVFQQLRLLIGDSLVSTIIIGSLVNLVLVVAGGTVGWRGSVVIAVLSPVVAFLEGHLKLPVLIPFVAIGNFVIALVFQLIVKQRSSSRLLWTGVVIGSIAKTAVLYALIVWFFVGFMLPGMGLPAKNVTAMTTALSLSFSWPQLVTALIGGAVAIPVIKRLRQVFTVTAAGKQA